MQAKTLIQRKLRSQWSDLQLLCLLEIAEGELVSFSELVEATGATEGGAWKALKACEDQGCLESVPVKHRTFYTLSEKGRGVLYKILK